MRSSSVVVRVFHCIRAQWSNVVLFDASTTIRYFPLAQTHIRQALSFQQERCEHVIARTFCDRQSANVWPDRVAHLFGKMAGHTNRNEFSSRFYNQGQTVPATSVASTTPPNINCPYHAPILEMAQRPATKETHPVLRFTNAPLSALPVGLSDKYRVGTSASGGCTCRHNTAIPKDAMARELESMMPNTANDAK